MCDWLFERLAGVVTKVRRIRPPVHGIVNGLTVFALMAILVIHFEDLTPGSYTPYFTTVQNLTECGIATGPNGDDCVQIARQVRSLATAMAAAIFTISAATGIRQAWSGVAAGLLAIKAVFHQMMYITNGDPMLPIALVVVAGLCTMVAIVPWMIVLSRERDQKD